MAKANGHTPRISRANIGLNVRVVGLRRQRHRRVVLRRNNASLARVGWLALEVNVLCWSVAY